MKGILALLSVLVLSSCDKTDSVVIRPIVFDKDSFTLTSDSQDFDIHVLTYESVQLTSNSNKYTQNKEHFLVLEPNRLELSWLKMEIDETNGRTIHISVKENEEETERQEYLMIFSAESDSYGFVTITQSAKQK